MMHSVSTECKKLKSDKSKICASSSSFLSCFQRYGLTITKKFPVVSILHLPVFLYFFLIFPFYTPGHLMFKLPESALLNATFHFTHLLVQSYIRISYLSLVLFKIALTIFISMAWILLSSLSISFWFLLHIVIFS